ncbi:MAG TPA: VWA domain-containing protein [Phycisphaerae bacterium]|nr:VWA domain-containing protein [Phycisphaerae bacterium]
MDSLQKLIPLGIDRPLLLWLLIIIIPLVILLGWRSLSGLGGGRKYAAVLLRSAVIAILIVLLCGAYRIRFVDDRIAIFVMDQSRSVPSDLQSAALKFVKTATAEMRPGKDRIAVLSFDGKTSIEQLAADRLKIDALGPGRDPDETNIAAALRMAAALIPGTEAARIVILSDGNETAGSAEEQAQTLAALDLPVDVVPLEFEHTNEVVFERLDAPASARIDETIGLSLVLRSHKQTAGRIRIYQGEEPIKVGGDAADDGFRVELNPGVNRMTLPIKLAEHGVHRFSAVFEPDSLSDDAVPHNNRGESFTRVGGKDRVLIIGNDDSSAGGAEYRSMQVIAEALAAQRIETDVVDAAQTQLDPATLFQYSAIIVSNVSALDLGMDGPAALASYTRDLGGGLIVIGGDQSFSVGGYYDTALEEILPVETNRRRLVTLNLALVCVIDRSGSMCGEKLELAKKAAAASARLLSSQDRIGVVAFDFDYEWAVKLMPCSNKDAILDRIRRIGCGGGTNMLPGMEAATDMLANAPVSLRHMILLTDGQSVPGDFAAAAKRAKKKGITITTVAVGPDADRALLSNIAKLADGRSYPAVDSQLLPRIFARETMLAGRSSIYEKTFTPKLRAELDDLLIRGLVSTGMPSLDGYVVTQPKPTASVLLINSTSHGDDPILAHWQVGLGRALAFTSGMWPKWGSRWIEWPAFSQFWTQIVRWASRSFGQQDAMVWTRVDGRKATISVELDQSNLALLPSALAGQVVDSQYNVSPIVLKPTGAGHFEAEFDVNNPGSYVVNVFHQGKDLSSLVRAGVTVAYSPEFAETHSNAALLRRIAEETSGRVLSADTARNVFDASAFREFRSRRPMEKELLTLAIVLLILDVAVRRIVIRKSDITAWISKRFGRVRLIAAEPQRATLSALRGARVRAQETRDTPGGASSSETFTADSTGDEPAAASVETPTLSEPAALAAALQSRRTKSAQPAEPFPFSFDPAQASAKPDTAAKPTASKPVDPIDAEPTTARLLSLRKKRQKYDSD